MDGRGDVNLRDPEYADGDCFPCGDEMDHQRRRARESAGQIAAADLRRDSDGATELKGEEGALSLKTLQFEFAKGTCRDEIL